MKIGIASAVIGDEFRDAVANATLAMRSYCQKFNYDFLLCEDRLDQLRPATMSKVLWVSHHLPNYDAIFWIDGDALIIDRSRRIEDVLGASIEDHSKDLILTRDWSGNINTGVFWLRNTPWSQRLLHAVYSQGISAPVSRAGGWDNTAFIKLYESDPTVAARTCLFNSQELQINCYPQGGQAITEETFVLHFAGVRDLERLKRWINHFSVHENGKKLTNLFWYPMIRARLRRRTPWVFVLLAMILSMRGPSLPRAERFTRLAWQYHSRGRETIATSLFERSLTIQTKIFGPDHPLIADLLEIYRAHLLESGRDTEARMLEARAKGIRAKSK